jgi:hypothetical protein
MLKCLELTKVRFELSSATTRHHLKNTTKVTVSQMTARERHAMDGQVALFVLLGAANVTVEAGVCEVVPVIVFASVLTAVLAGVVLTRVTARDIESHAYME